MKNITTLLIFIASFQAFGQSPEVLDKIESAKIALITQRLELTPNQAEKFWPIYREYSEKQRNIHKEFQDLRRDYRPNTATEEQSKALIDKGLEIKERMINLDKQYSDRMLTVINNRQLLRLREAENDFRQELMRRLRQQRDMQRDQLRDKPLNDEIRQQRQQQRGN
ncbi:MAG: hypothetical protein ACFHWX_10485 [Bacteroidota bacterium]